jgi:hypothetical protein
MRSLLHCYINEFLMTSDEPESLSWPDAGDWALVVPDGTWLPTNKTWHPDLRPWYQRDLAHGHATGAGTWNAINDIEDDDSDLGQLSESEDEEDSVVEGEDEDDGSTISDVKP